MTDTQTPKSRSPVDTDMRLRATAVIIDDGQVLLHQADGDSCWALPGGRVETGEDALTALRREMLEELGIAPLDCGALRFVVENFFSLGQHSYHELGLYFAASLPPESSLRDRGRSHWGLEPDRRLEFRWFPLTGLAHVDLRPACLGPALLAAPGEGVVHLVQGA